MLENLKRKVVQIAKDAENSGLCKNKSGNFSLRDPKTGMVLITPSGVSRQELTYKDILVVDIEGNIVDVETKVKPTTELPMHLAVYKSRNDVMGVVHTHSHFATAFAVASKEIKGVVFESLQYGGKVPLARYGRPGTESLGNSIVKQLEDHDACLLESHGVISAGKNIDDAYLKACYVEDVAEIYYRAIIINGGKEPNVIPQEEFTAVLEAEEKKNK